MTDKELQIMATTISKHEEQMERKMEQIANKMDVIEEKNNLYHGINKSEQKYGDVIVVQHNDYKWGVIDLQGNIIVPFGKYGWIDGFDSGLARVRTHGEIGWTRNTIGIINFDTNTTLNDKESIQKFYDNDRVLHPEKYAKWGIINEKGEEVLPVIYDEVYKFFGKNRYSTSVKRNGKIEEVFFHDLNPSLPVYSIHKSDYSIIDCDGDGRYFNINDCYDYEGNFDYDRLEDAILDGEYVVED
ncbi:MAG: WG repeat-containing protein [Bacteroidales bacterium]|nr:WG repeat-containing protein [Bacteroidales bacterium]